MVRNPQVFERDRVVRAHMQQRERRRVVKTGTLAGDLLVRGLQERDRLVAVLAARLAVGDPLVGCLAVLLGLPIVTPVRHDLPIGSAKEHRKLTLRLG
jgi:hypothetical protein